MKKWRSYLSTGFLIAISGSQILTIVILLVTIWFQILTLMERRKITAIHKSQITNETKAETPQVRPFDIEAAVNSVDKSRPPNGISIRVSSDGKYWWVPGELSAHGPYNSYSEALKSYWWSWEFELRCDPKNMVEANP